MRYLMIAFLLISSVASAQDDWGPATLIDSPSWWDLCGGQGYGYGFHTPSVTENDSTLFFCYWCFDQSGIAYSIFRDGGWQAPVAIPESIIGEYPGLFFYFEGDSTLYFVPDYDSGIWRTRLRDGLWMQPESLSSVINVNGNETSPSLPRDGARLYFERNNNIMYSEIVNGEFSEPVILPEIINSPDSTESEPRINPDGNRLYFNRGLGYYNVNYKMRYSAYSDGQWQAPADLNDNINFGRPVSGCMNIIGKSSSPSFSRNGTKMYFGFTEPIPIWCEPASGIFVSELVSGIDDGNDNIPHDFSMTAYPNPFNSEVKISLLGSFKDVFGITIYNIAGQAVRKLQIAQNVIWDGKNDAGIEIASGVYFVQAAGDGVSRTIKVALVR